jgi:hypothetical protein
MFGVAIELKDRMVLSLFLQAGARASLSHRRLRRRPLAGDRRYISTKEKIARIWASSSAGDAAAAG